MKNILMSPVTKKVLGITGAVVSGVFTVFNVLSEQKKAREFEGMKKAISDLQKQVKGS